MALPHRVAGIVCDLGRVTMGSYTVDENVVPADTEDHTEWREKVCFFDPDPPSYIPAGKRHYFANYPHQVINIVFKTLFDGDLTQGNPSMDKDNGEYVVISSGNAVDETNSDKTKLPVFKAWIEPISCRVDNHSFDNDLLSVDTRDPTEDGWDSGTDNRNEFLTAAQSLFENYCEDLRASLVYWTETFELDESDDIYPIRPRWKNESPYTKITMTPYETPACPFIVDFVCPWYYTDDDSGYHMVQRGLCDFGYTMTTPYWGPWTVTDARIIHVEGHYETSYNSYDYWVFDYYEETSDPNDEGDTWVEAGRPSGGEPYITIDEFDVTHYWVSHWHKETYITEYTYWVEPYDYQNSGSFEYPYDCRPSYKVTPKYGIKFSGDEECCWVKGTTLKFKVRIYQAPFMNADYPHSRAYEGTFTYAENCVIDGKAKGNAGNRGKSTPLDPTVRGLEYFLGYPACERPSEGYPKRNCYHGHAFAPLFGSAEEFNVIDIEMTIGEGLNPYLSQFELDAPEGRFLYIKDFWLDEVVKP